jgi:hypothetical protein
MDYSKSEPSNLEFQVMGLGVKYHDGLAFTDP